MLQFKGLIEIRPKRGTTVLPPGNRLHDREVQTWMQASTPTPALLVELVEIRSASEPLAAALAAKRGKPEALAIIDRAHCRWKKLCAAVMICTTPTWLSILLSLRPRVVAFLPDLPRSLARRFYSASASPMRPRGDRVGDLAVHTRVANAIRNRNEQDAEQAMRALLLDVARTIERLGMQIGADPAQGGQE